MKNDQLHKTGENQQLEFMESFGREMPLNGFTRSGLEVTAQDTAQVRDLIINMEEEMTREEIQKSLGLTHRENFRLLYLRPALESGLIEMTIPDKPNSKYQKYRLTEKGKRIKKL